MHRAAPSPTALHEAAHVAAILAMRLELIGVEMRPSGESGAVLFRSARHYGDGSAAWRIMDGAVALAGVLGSPSTELSRSDRAFLEGARLTANEMAAARNLARRIIDGNGHTIREIAGYLDRRIGDAVEGEILEERYRPLIRTP